MKRRTVPNSSGAKRIEILFSAIAKATERMRRKKK